MRKSSCENENDFCDEKSVKSNVERAEVTKLGSKKRNFQFEIYKKRKRIKTD